MSSAERGIRRHLPAVVLAAGVLTLLVLAVWLVPWLMTRGSGLGTADRFKAMADIRTALIAALVMLGGGGSLAYTARTFRLSKVSHLTGRFESAAKQIGDSDETVRLAGMYALAQLADGWAEQRQACIDVLCVHLRLPQRGEAGTPAGGDSRRTALEIIADRLRAGHPVSWDGCDFDLRGAVLDDTDFSGIRLAGGRFHLDEAEFRGHTRFDGARFAGADVSLKGAKFALGSIATFDDAHFTRGTVAFDRMRLGAGELSFERAVMGSGCRVTFDDATFSDGDLSLRGARCEGATVSFAGACFQGSGSACFDLTRLSGRLIFDRAELSKDVTFHGARIDDADLSFAGAKLVSGRLTFDSSTGRRWRFLLDETSSAPGGKIDLIRLAPESQTPTVLGREPRGMFVGLPRHDDQVVEQTDGTIAT